MPDADHPGIRRIVTVERAMAVLDVLADAAEDLGTNEIARRTAINASSVSRLLGTLAQRGLVERTNASGRYRLGLRLVELGNAALARVDIRDLARAHLVALSEATGETATLSIPDEHETVTVDFVQSPASVQSVARVGRPSVAHATAVGKVFLAHGGAPRPGQLQAYTQRTITDREELAREIARTAERGWAQSVGEREPDLNAVAAPVLDGDGRLLAVLGVQGPASRFDRRAMRAGVEPLLDRARRITSR